MKRNDTMLAEMPIRQLFVRLAVPAVLAQMINILYNLVDKMFIGHIPQYGREALAGVGVTTPVILAVSAFAALVSMGGAPKVSILLGRQQKETAEKVIGTCTWMILVMSLVLTIIMRVFGQRSVVTEPSAPRHSISCVSFPSLTQPTRAY